MQMLHWLFQVNLMEKILLPEMWYLTMDKITLKERKQMFLDLKFQILEISRKSELDMMILDLVLVSHFFMDHLFDEINFPSIFVVFISCVPMLTLIKMCKLNLNSGWFLDKVIITKVSSDQSWYFLCGKWLDSDEDDKQIVREIPATEDGQASLPLVTYQIKVTTGNWKQVKFFWQGFKKIVTTVCPNWCFFLCTIWVIWFDLCEIITQIL